MDYNKTLNLPETEYPMRGNLPAKEPVMLENWDNEELYKKILHTFCMTVLRMQTAISTSELHSIRF